MLFNVRTKSLKTILWLKNTLKDITQNDQPYMLLQLGKTVFNKGCLFFPYHSIICTKLSRSHFLTHPGMITRKTTHPGKIGILRDNTPKIQPYETN